MGFGVWGLWLVICGPLFVVWGVRFRGLGSRFTDQDSVQTLNREYHPTVFNEELTFTDAALQGQLAHKSPPPPPRTTIGP